MPVQSKKTAAMATASEPADAMNADAMSDTKIKMEIDFFHVSISMNVKNSLLTVAAESAKTQ